MTSFHSAYLDNVFSPEEFGNTVKRVTALAKEVVKKHEADAIAFRGHSGSALGYILGYTLELPIILIRKDSESSHWNSQSMLEGYIGTKRYIIVDDFIASGRTVDTIMETIQEKCPAAECVAMLMYNQPTRRKMYHCKKPSINEQGRLIMTYSARFSHWVDDKYVEFDCQSVVYE